MSTLDKIRRLKEQKVRELEVSPEPAKETNVQGGDCQEAQIVTISKSKTTKMSLDDALKVFGHAAFREGQREAITEAMEGKDGVLCVFPTGAGKSLVYQIPSVMSENLTVVVSPLISLMKDQVDKLQSLGINAILINSSLPLADAKVALAEVSTGGVRALYVSPERFENPEFNRAIERLKVDIFAVDECHCISRWGHDFRPAYAELGGVIERINPRQVVALTATATDRVRGDICRSLHIEKAARFIQSVYRPNLHFVVMEASGWERFDYAMTVAADSPTGIVYATTRKEVEAACDYMCKRGVKATCYHAGLPPNVRSEIQEKWSRDGGVIVATSAFGMGIDRPDVRFVVHIGLSPSIEDWYQAVGRAGRDGKDALCFTVCDFNDDYRTQVFLVDMTNPSGKDVKGFWGWLKSTAAKIANGGTVAEIGMTQKVMGEESGFHNVGACISFLKQRGLVRTLGRGSYQVRLDLDDTLDLSQIDGSRKDRLDKLDALVRFYRSGDCRFEHVCGYFGDVTFAGPCKKCDRCNP